MKIAVYCSSSNRIADHYKLDAFKLGVLIAEDRNSLVYGGATGGLMDAVAEGAKSKNGQIIGVISQPIIRMKRLSDLPTELIVVETMSQRKEKMKEISDLFIILPGSYGTLDEMLDVIVSGVVGEHKKPLILINKNGFYNHFLEHINFIQKENFMPSVETYKPIIARDNEHCLEIINSLVLQKI